MRVGEGFHRLVNVFAIIDARRPIPGKPLTAFSPAVRIAAFVFVSLMMVALFAARLAVVAQDRPAPTTVLLNVTLLGILCADLIERAYSLLAIASLHS